MAMTAASAAGRLVAWFPHSGGANRKYGLGWGLEAGRGYDEFFDRQVYPLAEAGVTWFGVWMPFGLGTMTDAPGQALNADALADLREAGDADLVANLAHNLARCRRRFSGVRWIMYVGSLLEPDLVGLKLKARPLAYARRVIDSLAPLINEPSVSIAWDHRATYGSASVEAAACQFVDALMREAAPRGYDRGGFIEGPPHRGRADHVGLPVCCTEAVWRRSRPADDVEGPGFADSRWALPSQEIAGDVVRIDQGPMADPVAAVHRMAHVVAHPTGRHAWAGGLNYVVGPGRAFPTMQALGERVADRVDTLLSVEGRRVPTDVTGGELDGAAAS